VIRQLVAGELVVTVEVGTGPGEMLGELADRDRATCLDELGGGIDQGAMNSDLFSLVVMILCLSVFYCPAVLPIQAFSSH
jgi:hypothetical protein